MWLLFLPLCEKRRYYVLCVCSRAELFRRTRSIPFFAIFSSVPVSIVVSTPMWSALLSKRISISRRSSGRTTSKKTETIHRQPALDDQKLSSRKNVHRNRLVKTVRPRQNYLIHSYLVNLSKNNLGKRTLLPKLAPVRTLQLKLEVLDLHGRPIPAQAGYASKLAFSL